MSRLAPDEGAEFRVRTSVKEWLEAWETNSRKHQSLYLSTSLICSGFDVSDGFGFTGEPVAVAPELSHDCIFHPLSKEAHTTSKEGLILPYAY